MTFEYSMGTKPAIEAMTGMISSSDSTIDTIMINMATIVRNCISNKEVKELVDEEKRKHIHTLNPAKLVRDMAKKEMLEMIDDLTEVYTNSGHIRKPHLIIYHALYERCIPADIYREPSEGKQLLVESNELVAKELIKDRSTTTRKKLKIIETPCRGSEAPWRVMLREIKHIGNNHCVMMLSNHPVDYHVAPYCKAFMVVRSHTGDIVTSQNLNTFVFGKDTTEIPFNIYTHAILGDKVDVKSSINNEEKTTVIEAAEAEDWSVKTQEYIRDQLYRMKIKVPTF